MLFNCWNCWCFGDVRKAWQWLATEKSNTSAAQSTSCELPVLRLPVVGYHLWVSFKRKLIGLARSPARSFTAALGTAHLDIGVTEPSGILHLWLEQMLPGTALAWHRVCLERLVPTEQLPSGHAWQMTTPWFVLLFTAGRTFECVFSMMLLLVMLRGRAALPSPFDFGKKQWSVLPSVLVNSGRAY